MLQESRPSFGRLHELRALVPSGTPMIALTAIVTPEIRYVIKHLDMKGCVCLPTNQTLFMPCSEIETDLLPLETRFYKSESGHSLLPFP